MFVDWSSYKLSSLLHRYLWTRFLGSREHMGVTGYRTTRLEKPSWRNPQLRLILTLTRTPNLTSTLNFNPNLSQVCVSEIHRQSFLRSAFLKVISTQPIWDTGSLVYDVSSISKQSRQRVHRIETVLLEATETCWCWNWRFAVLILLRNTSSPGIVCPVWHSSLIVAQTQSLITSKMGHGYNFPRHGL